jgi:DNA repair protein RecO (recombination protein O)
MIQKTDIAIVLSRTDYGEKDRIITFLGQKEGKMSVLAKSVRSQKSKLAAGCELLSTTQISFVGGKSSLLRLTGSRLLTHYGDIATDLSRMNQAFEFLRIIGQVCEQGHGQEYYSVVDTALKCLNEPAYDNGLVEVWFNIQILYKHGVLARVKPVGEQARGDTFVFDHDLQRFVSSGRGEYSQDDLKVLQLSLHSEKPIKLRSEHNNDAILKLTRLLMKTNAFAV